MNTHSPSVPFGIADATRGVHHVFVRNLEVMTHIGIYGHEQGKPQPVRINIDLAVSDPAAVEDRIENVVDYEAVTRKVHAIIAQGHINLAETLAERIASACLEDRRILTARVRVEKLHALPGAESGGVEIERRAPRDP
jgi:dihydroneopterin aldolase